MIKEAISSTRLYMQDSIERPAPDEAQPIFVAKMGHENGVNCSCALLHIHDLMSSSLTCEHRLRFCATHCPWVRCSLC
jgi:hypothetical protein